MTDSHQPKLTPEPPSTKIDDVHPLLDAPAESLQLLAAVRQLELIEQQLAAAVVAARQAGFTWQQVADCLGTSTQAAWKRFHQLELTTRD